MTTLILHNYGTSLSGGENMLITEGIIKIIPMIYSIIITGAILYELRLPRDFKENIWLLIGLSIILTVGILNLVAHYRSYGGSLCDHSIGIYIGNFIIITSLLRSIKSVKRYAYKDRLTGAYNTYTLYNSIELHIKKAKRLNSVFTLAFIDIDDFKSINDNFGHIVADAMLKDICTSIRKKIRKKDLLFRYGGDEFVLLIPEFNKKDTWQLMKRLESEVNKESGETVHFSYGTASYPGDGNNAEVLLNAADIQMYCQKNCKH